MSLQLPDRVTDLNELGEDDHRALYVADDGGEGFRLSRRRLADFEAFLTRVAEVEAQHAAMMTATAREIEAVERQHRRLVTEGDVRRALVEAGARPELLDAAIALFIHQTPLRVEGKLGADARAVLDDPVSVADVAFAVSAWLESPAGRPYATACTAAGDGAFARRLRHVTRQQ